MKLATAVAIVLATLPGIAAAEDLMKVYQDALQNDPQIRQADATRLANREARPQALAALLPQVQATGSREKDRADTGLISALPEADPLDPTKLIVVPYASRGTVYPDITQWALTIRQSVFSWQNLVTLKEAGRQVAQAEADYKAAEEDLISRVATGYFNVLTARDNLEAQQAAYDADERQLEQANKRFDVGLIAITDVEEAKAARDSAAAAVIAAKRSLATSVQDLSEYTGSKYDQLTMPGPDMPLKNPEPADEGRWVDVSMDQNLTLVSSRLAAEVARDNVSVAFGGHLPQVDLVAGRNYLKEDSAEIYPGLSVPLDQRNFTDSIQLQVTVPIFSGGATQSKVRQSQYLWIAAKQKVVQVSRQTESAARDAYLSVIADSARVTALRQALESSQTSQKATEAGYDVGTRTAVDVLTTRQNLIQAQTNYARSRYDYIIDILNLKEAAGNLDRTTLAEINGWLNVTVPTTGAAAAQPVQPYVTSPDAPVAQPPAPSKLPPPAPAPR